MIGADEFVTLVKGEIVATRGDQLDRLKCLLNFLNVAHLRLPGADQSDFAETEVLLAFYVLGRVEDEGRRCAFRPLGEVVLPWCRHYATGDGSVEAAGPDESLPTESEEDSDGGTFCRVRIVGPGTRHGGAEGRDHWGEGSRPLYESVRRWWENLEVESPNSTDLPQLPWPEDSMSSRRSDQGSRVFEVPSSPVAVRRGDDAAAALPNRLARGAQSVLLVPTTIDGDLDALIGVVLARSLDNDPGAAQVLSTLIAELARFACRGSIAACPGDTGAVGTERGRPTQTENGSGGSEPWQDPYLERALHCLWEDLSRYGSEGGLAESGGPRVRADELLVMLREVHRRDYDSGGWRVDQYVRYHWFDAQLQAMHGRLQAHLEHVQPVEHLLRCLAIAGAGRTDEDPGDREGLGHLEEAFWALLGSSEFEAPDGSRVSRGALLQWMGAHSELLPQEPSEIWDPRPRIYTGGVHDDRPLSRVERTESARRLWSECLHRVRSRRFPLVYVLSNTTMDSGAVELVRTWTSEGRVARAPLTGSDGEAGDGLGYPADLLLSELALLSPTFGRGVLFVPLMAPVNDPGSSGEFPAFGLAMVRADEVAGKTQLDSVRAAQVIRRHTAALHNAVLLRFYEEITADRATIADESVWLADLVARSVSLTTRVHRVTRNGEARPSKLSVPFPELGLSVIHDGTGRPSRFSTTFAGQLGRAVRRSRSTGYEDQARAWGHEAGQVTMLLGDSYVWSFMEEYEEVLDDTEMREQALVIPLGETFRAVRDYVWIWAPPKNQPSPIVPPARVSVATFLEGVNAVAHRASFAEMVARFLSNKFLEHQSERASFNRNVSVEVVADKRVAFVTDYWDLNPGISDQESRARSMEIGYLGRALAAGVTNAIKHTPFEVFNPLPVWVYSFVFTDPDRIVILNSTTPKKIEGWKRRTAEKDDDWHTVGAVRLFLRRLSHRKVDFELCPVSDELLEECSRALSKGPNCSSSLSDSNVPWFSSVYSFNEPVFRREE